MSDRHFFRSLGWPLLQTALVLVASAAFDIAWFYMTGRDATHHCVATFALFIALRERFHRVEKDPRP